MRRTLGLNGGCSETGTSCATSSEPRADWDRVCDQISSCRASSADGAEPGSVLLITLKPICQQIVLKLACKVLCALLVSNCLEADNLLLLSIILLTQSVDFYAGNLKDLNSSDNLPKCQCNATSLNFNGGYLF